MERDSACDHLSRSLQLGVHYLSIPSPPPFPPFPSLKEISQVAFLIEAPTAGHHPSVPTPPTLWPVAKTTGSHWMGCDCVFNTRFCLSLCSQLVEREELRVDSAPLLGPGFFAFPNQWKLTRGQIRNSGKALLGPRCSVCRGGGSGGAGEETTGSLTCLFPARRGSLSLYGVGMWVGMCPGVWRRSGLGGLPTPRVMQCAGDMGRNLLLLLTLGFCSRLLKGNRFFGLFAKICPTMHARSYF